MFKESGPNEIENWVCVLEKSTKLEIELAKNYLSSLRIPSNILSKQDTAYSLTVGDMAKAYLYVPVEFEAEARKALDDLQNAGNEETDINGEDT